MTDNGPPSITRADLRDDLARIGLQAGDTVMVHAAMGRVRRLLNGPDALIGALLDVLGPEGTLVAYTDWDSFHTDLMDDDGRVLPEWREHVPPFDHAASRAQRRNGILPEFVRTTPGARRSANPGASVAALGHLADWITADHPQDYGYGPGTPLAKLVAAGGRVLIVGAPWDTMTLVHHADHLADIPNKRVLRYEVPFAGEHGTEWRFIEEFDTSEPIVDGLPDDYIERIVTAFVGEGNGRPGAIGGAPALLVEAAPMCAFAVSWLERAVAVLSDVRDGWPSPRRGDRIAGRTEDLDAETLAAIRVVEPGPRSHEAERRLRLVSDASIDRTDFSSRTDEARDPMAEIRAAIVADNVAIRARFMREVETLTSAKVEVLARPAPDASGTPRIARSPQRTMFSVPYEKQERYPAFQFGADGEPLPVIRDILAILPKTMTPWQIAFWFVSSNSWLGGPAPRDHLDDPAALIKAAGHENDPIGG
jgi:aminoglycoside 3-N-acetyltransferase